MSVGVISELVFGCNISSVFSWVRFFREVAGYYEDAFPIKMAGPNLICEGDSRFVIGKRKCGVGR